MVLYRNQWPVNFILHFAVFHIGSSIRYENTLFKYCFLKCYIVKRNLISFNFSEYSYNSKTIMLIAHTELLLQIINRYGVIINA